MTRSEHFEQLKTHAWFSKIWAKLRDDDFVIAREFLRANETLSKGEFEFAINRMFLDKPFKPKRWKEIQELLLIANSSLK